MSLSDPTDTLAYHQSRVLTTNRCMMDTPCVRTSNQISAYTLANSNTNKHAYPEQEALWFYGMNHGMSLLQAEYDPMESMSPDDILYVKEYYRRMNASAVRAFCYLVLICTREARHNKSLSKHASKIKSKFGSDIVNFYKGIKGGEQDIHQTLLSDPPDASIGAYVQSLQWVFYRCEWTGGYGGPAWGAVADCLVNFVTGEFTAEMMLDTNWTLAHNNGPIFNKGILYRSYSDQLSRVLDVQRSGQIPEAILYDSGVSHYATEDMRKYMNWIRWRFPDALGDYVDWYKVSALGGIHYHNADKLKQSAEHGESPYMTDADKSSIVAALIKVEANKMAVKEATKANKEYAKKKAEKDLYHKEHCFEVLPNVWVDKVETLRDKT